MERWTVYCHTHIESKRRYVGVTKHTMAHRWNQHCVQARKSKGGRWHFPNAIRKYGKDAFSHEVLGVFSSLSEANAEEKRLISLWDLCNPSKGFNVAKGGVYTPHPIRRNPWDRPEYRAKMQMIAKRRWDDPDYRDKMLHVDRSWAGSAAHLLTPAVRARSAAALARPDVRQKISAGNRASFASGNRARPAAPSLGTRQKIANSLKSKLTSDEYKLCKRHGLIPVASCMMEKTAVGERLRCRQCMREAVRRSRKKAT